MIVCKQHRFCKGKLGFTYLLELRDCVTETVDKAEWVDIYLDFQNSFMCLTIGYERIYAVMG